VKGAFLESNGLRDHVLVKLGSEVRAVLPAPCPSKSDHSAEGARGVTLVYGAAAASSPAQARFKAVARTVDDRLTVLLDERLTFPAGGEGTFGMKELALPPQTHTLRLETSGNAANAFWARPAFSGRGGASGRSVIVISLDTVRADHLNAYGYTKRKTSPEFDDWADQGALFENALSPAPGTLSSQMALLTGRYPSNHGVSYANWRLGGQIPVLPAQVHTLAGILRARGVLTAAFTGAGYFALPLGYSRGFTEYVSSDDETLGGAATVFGKALPWLERHRDDDFFLFLHTYEAHEPYLDGRFVEREQLASGDWKTRTVALYDGDICRADCELGRLRRALGTLGLSERTLVFIVSDHGEEFGDHFDVWNDGHGHALFQEQVHVPFVIIGPTVKKGLRLPQPVDLTSVLPTVLSFLQAPIPHELDGRDLMVLLRGQASAGEWTAFSEDVWIGPSRFAIRTPDYKLVVQGADLPERFLDNKMKMTIRESVTRLEPEQLFHLPQDTHERENLLARDPARAAELRARLLTHRNSLIPPHKAETGRIAVEGESLERLRALGYVE
jgi:arylsulfatase A-like enzyme